MDEFDVIITPDAEADLNDLDDYITFELMAPDTALAYIHTIRHQVSSLKKVPKRYKIVDDEPWHTRGLRRMNARGFAVFFNIDEEHRTVYVQNIVYQKRDLPSLLQKLYSYSDSGSF